MSDARHDPRFRDPRWFPVDLGVRRRDYMCLQLEDRVLDTSVFIDNRIEAPLNTAERVNADCVDVRSLAQGPVGWIWHTSFCGSSLLARCLHVPPAQVSLKEPLILRRLGDGRFSGFDLADGPELSASLLARPWHEGGGIVIKPTHAALNVAADLMQALPRSRAILLHSDLEDFIVSNIKKSPETQQRIGLLAERALRATSLFSRLPPQAAHPPDFLCAAALQWSAQRELCLDTIRATGDDRIRTLDAKLLYADPGQVATRSQQWLGLPASVREVAVRASAVAAWNAKAIQLPYDFETRKREAAQLRNRYGPLITRALEWAGQTLLPSMRKGAINFPASLCG